MKSSKSGPRSSYVSTSALLLAFPPVLSPTLPFFFLLCGCWIGQERKWANTYGRETAMGEGRKGLRRQMREKSVLKKREEEICRYLQLLFLVCHDTQRAPQLSQVFRVHCTVRGTESESLAVDGIQSTCRVSRSCDLHGAQIERISPSTNAV